MENINNPNPDLLSTEQLEVDEQSGTYLKDASVWAKAIAIIGIIICGLVIIVLISSLILGSTNTFTTPGYLIGIFIVIIFVIGIALIGIINLFKFSNGIATAVNNQDATAFEKGITGLKYYFIFMGVLTLLLTLVSVVQLIK